MHGKGLSNILSISKPFWQSSDQPPGRQNIGDQVWMRESKRGLRRPSGERRELQMWEATEGHGRKGIMTGRSQKRIEGHRRKGQEGRDHRRSWNPMEGREDSVRIPWNLIEPDGILKKDGVTVLTLFTTKS